jgi:hypothetical protein
MMMANADAIPEAGFAYVAQNVQDADQASSNEKGEDGDGYEKGALHDGQQCTFNLRAHCAFSLTNAMGVGANGFWNTRACRITRLFSDYDMVNSTGCKIVLPGGAYVRSITTSSSWKSRAATYVESLCEGQVFASSFGSGARQSNAAPVPQRAKN